MRIFALLSFAALTLLPITHLQAEPEDESTAESVASEIEGDTSPDEVGANLLGSTGYNRWVCYATSSSRYYGYSQWFAQGSGQGQAAHLFAYRDALQNCRLFSFGQICYINFQSSCYVERN